MALVRLISGTPGAIFIAIAGRTRYPPIMLHSAARRLGNSAYAASTAGKYPIRTMTTIQGMGRGCADELYSACQRRSGGAAGGAEAVDGRVVESECLGADALRAVP